MKTGRSAFRVAIGVALLAAGLALPARGAPPPAPGAADELRLLDVPYVPQSAALCGGAALAMVLRYWGQPGSRAEEFAGLLTPDASGIRTDSLVAAVRARGWVARPLEATAALLRAEVAAGHPMIALIDAGHGALHYVVVVAWTADDAVLLHDPAVGPYRIRARRDFEAAWARAGRWALLVLPPPATPLRSATTDTSSAVPTPAAPDSLTPQPAAATPAATGCARLVADGVARAAAGDSAGAEARFLAAAALCPASAAPWRERAGLRFAGDAFVEAAALARRALALEPDDADTWRLLAASLYLAGDTEGALGAWNHVDEPRTDLTRIDGLVRTRYRAVADPLALAPRQLITPGAFRRARRRLEELPGLSDTRLSVTPRSGGVAQVNVALLERPLLFEGPLDLAGVGLHALVEREAGLDLAGPLGLGELWSAEGRWWRERPLVRVALAVPGVAGRPGLWRVEGLWERQAYARPRAAAPGDSAPEAEPWRTRRRRTSLSYADWVTSDLRLAGDLALDGWRDRGACPGLGFEAEARAARDRLGVRLRLGAWADPGGAPFQAVALEARWPARGETPGGWRLRAGVESASARAPLDLWPGAGTGVGRAALLRAHPLLEEGIVTGPAFGRTLLAGGLERVAWPWRVGPLRLGVALFLDAARPFQRPGGAAGRAWFDAGAGLRLGGAGGRGPLRVDVARGLAGGDYVVSVGWLAD